MIKRSSRVSALFVVLALATGCSHADKGGDAGNQTQSTATGVAADALSSSSTPAPADSASVATAQQTDSTAAPGDSTASSGDATASPSDASAPPSDATAPSSDAAAPPSDATAQPNNATAVAAADTTAACGLLTSAQVEEALHLHVDTVKVTSTTCDFTFKDSLTQLTIEYDAQGGADQLAQLRTANAGVQAAVGGIIKTTAAGGANASDLAQKAMADTDAPNVPKVGSDQYAFTAGPAKFLGVVNGEAYVEITGTFLPESLNGWQVEADLASRTFAAKK